MILLLLRKAEYLVARSFRLLVHSEIALVRYGAHYVLQWVRKIHNIHPNLVPFGGGKTSFKVDVHLQFDVILPVGHQVSREKIAAEGFLQVFSPPLLPLLNGHIQSQRTQRCLAKASTQIQ